MAKISATPRITDEPLLRKLIEELLHNTRLEIKPVLQPGSEPGFCFPPVQELLSISPPHDFELLERLAKEEILERCYHTTLISCPRCHSSEIRLGQGCPRCMSWNIRRDRVLEHFNCGNLGLEEEYLSNDKLVCPRCHQEMKFLGTDYQSLGINYKCASCQNIFAQAVSTWQCPECFTFFAENEAERIPLYSYHINEAMRRWLEFELGPRARLVDFLRNRGYQVWEDAVVDHASKSGATHLFDILAKREDGITTHIIAIDALIEGTASEVGLEKVFAYDNKVYDLGIHDKVIIAIPRLSPAARQFARRQRIRIFEGEELANFLESAAPAPHRSEKRHFECRGREGLLQFLKDAGYRVEENATLPGRSGARHTFDIFASYDDGILTHTMAVGIMESTGEVGFEPVAAFDARAYDVGVHEKVLLVSPRLSPEARRFADYQRIKVIEIDSAALLT